MTKSTLTAILVLVFCIKAAGASTDDTAVVESSIVLHTGSGDIIGTITTPKIFNKIPVALIIAGSGPTDRNGNNPMMKNESLRMLAHRLADNNIGSLRFDKRGIGESKAAAKSEADLRFEDYINDAKSWLELLKKDGRFSKLIVIGHSEGSLIGMIAALHAADGFVSIAGAGQSADKILKAQLINQPPVVKDMAFPIIDSLVLGLPVKDINPALYSLFRPSVLPYIISWFKYDPQTEIKKLKIPVLILQGTNDLQISAEDASLLAKADPLAQLVLIKNMNHILKIVDTEKSANIAAYNNPLLPVANELVDSIAAFIRKI